MEAWKLLPDWAYTGVEDACFTVCGERSRCGVDHVLCDIGQTARLDATGSWELGVSLFSCSNGMLWSLFDRELKSSVALG